MTAPEVKARKGSPLVVGMLVLIVLIIWTFDLYVSAFGPPEAAMAVHFRNELPGQVDVLVRTAGAPGWSILFGGDEPTLAAGEERQAFLMAGEERHWAVAFRDDTGERARHSLSLDPERQVRLRLSAEGELFVRDGPAALPISRQAHLAERALGAAGPPAPGQELPRAEAELPEAPEIWSLGRPRQSP